MRKLINLEFKKGNIGKYVNIAVIANIVILSLIAIIVIAEKIDGNLEPMTTAFTFHIVDSLIKATFIVIASIMICTLVIDEYKDNTITVLFMYPISRKKLIVAKLSIVVVFTFIAIVLSNIFIDSILIIINSFINFIVDKVTIGLVMQQAVKIIVNALATSGMALIPLYFGMKKKSVPTTIATSLIIVSIICSGSGTFSLGSIIIIPITLAIIGFIGAYLSIKDIEHVDAIKY